jgi:hypothetical protein
MATPKQQKEYNSQLKETKSLLADMQTAIEKSIKDSDKRNKKLLEFASLNKKILGDLKGEEDAAKKILQLEEKRKSVSDGMSSMNAKQKKLAQKELKTIDDGIKSEQQKIQNLIQNESLQEKISEIANLRVKTSKADFGINEKHQQKLVAQLTAQEQILRNELKQQEIMTAVGKTVDDVTKSFGDQLKKVDDILEDIPLIGGFLKNQFEPLKDKGTKAATEIGSAFKSNFNSSFLEARKGGASFFKSFNTGISGGTKAAMQMGRGILVALGPIGAAVLLLAAGFAIGLKSFKELDAAAKSFREDTGLLLSQTGQLNRDIASTRVEFASLGVSAKDVAKSASDFSNEFGGIEQPSKAVLGSMVMLNKNFGIGTAEASKLNKVFQNIGDLSAEQSQFLIGQTTEMAKMAGVAPQQVIADMAESSEYAYKYFQGSPKELAKAAVQAAKMGTSIAEAGKAADNLLDFQSSITKELEASAILGVNLNLSQARYAAANGDLIGQQQAINDQVAQLGDLTKLNVFEQQALADATGMEFSSLVNQQRIRERFGKLNKEQLAAATSLLDAGKDIADINSADLKNQSARLKSQQEMASAMDRFGNETGAIGAAIGDAFRPIAEFVMPILNDVISVVGKILVPAFQLVGKVLSSIFGVLKPIFSFIMTALLGVASIVGGIIDIFVNGFGYVADFIGKIGDIIETYVIGPIRSFFDGIGSIIGTLGGLFGGGSDDSSSSESVNDGVMQGGKVITTDPADFLLATKDPGGLAQELSGGVGMDMSGVIAELQSLKTAFLSNKDVYMDKSLVTSAVTNTQERSGRENRFGLQGA